MKYLCPKCGKRLLRSGSTPVGKKRWICKTREVFCYTTTNPKALTQQSRSNTAAKRPVFKRSLRGANRFIVTAAQNATPVHKDFIKSLETACNHLNAELIVIPLRYKNPTSRWTPSQANEEVWADEVQPYLCNQRKNLNRDLKLLGDIKTQPTATSPLTGFDAITHGESGILGHTKLQLKTIPTPQHSKPKILTTTGACTVANYTDSKAGKLGEFHHTLGACMVEVGRGKFHLRQINGSKEDGSFIDLDKRYGPVDAGSGEYYAVGDAPSALALVMGDTHVGFTDPKVERATFGPDGMVEVLKPATLVWHDLFDGYSVNPHHRKNYDPFMNLAKHRAGKHDVRAEVERAIEFVVEHTRADQQSIIVYSNHNDFLRRWMASHDWRTDPKNAEFYHEIAAVMARGSRMTEIGAEYPDPFIYCVERAVEAAGLKNIRCLRRDESCVIGSISVDMHGHEGPNGSRGSIRNLRRIGVKSFIAHGHGPGIDEGCSQVGTSTRLRAEFTHGPGNWLQTHGALYANDKRSLLNIIGDEWRL